ncbi:uncharacterized protein BP5553_09838 [Venustampulla echinocandica]|uniref:Myb-like domain-containing protein n=1 Tax=Venustampulla echinocandica TaxID=2656787 RepID=A0A370TAU6_9HELO|nr:uncharacterized protein BP5553_09838 [Venustampulla echinocandica]RDL31049.1 hypothetical protein BP5553_09838 [Venustampulla echinocandica]
MPKGDRHRSVRTSGYYTLSPAAQPAQYEALNTSRIPDQYYSGALTTGMPQQSYSPPHTSSYSTGGPVQHPMVAQQQYAPMPPAPLTSIRASSGAWNPTDDQTLMAARAQGMNWAPIQQAYFPNKTPNACRKRHERLMERRSADDWDGVKLENMAKTYMGMRREIWSGLAAQTGEKWNVVEQKCMSQGLKNLQTAARAHARRERLLDNSGAGGVGSAGMLGVGAYDVRDHHADDSGIGSIEDLEAEYDATDGGASSSGRSTSSVYATHQGHHGHYHSHSGGSAVGSMVDGRGGGGYTTHQQRGQRLPSMDMGIDAIINRPNNGR